MNAIISGKMEKPAGSLVFNEVAVWDVANDNSPYELRYYDLVGRFYKYTLRIGMQQPTGIAYTYLSINSFSVGGSFELLGENDSIYESIKFYRFRTRDDDDIYWEKQHIAGTSSFGLLKSLTFGFLE
jgi:hypothetical protein